ncbi:calcineurin-binding protein cabin-1-like isoform X1 [Argonauta hians]
MIRIAALNDYDSDDSDDSSDDKLSITKEAQEAEAYTIYNQALNFQIEGDIDSAEETFEDLLEQDFLLEASRVSEEENNPVHPGLQLLYSTYKNLANMAHQRNELHRAIQYFLKAVTIDETELTVWYKIGLLALDIHNYQLAAYSFQQGLTCNMNHWPCMDHVITALYVINDYWTCLKYIGYALEKDPEFTKALSFRDQIFDEQPSLQSESKKFFANCDTIVLRVRADKEEKTEYINEALEMRKIRRELAYVPPASPISLPKPIKEYTWKCVGECLLALYDDIVQSEPPKSMAVHVDLSPYVKTQKPPNDKTEVEAQDPEAPNNPSEEPEVQATSEEGESAMEVTSAEAGQTAGNNGTTSPTLNTSSPNTSANANATEGTAMEVEESGSRKAQKRKRTAPVEEVACKRRSARVRNTTRKKQEENVDLEDLLLKFLPSSLLEARDEEENKIKEEGSPQGVSSAAGSSESSTPLVFDSEDRLVRKFLDDCLENGGVIDLMATYLVQLADVGHLKWSEELIDVFLRMYSAARKQLKLPSYLCPDEPDYYILEMGKMVLVWAELQLDRWLVKKAKIKAPMNSSNRNLHNNNNSFSLNQLEAGFPGQFFVEDVWHVLGLIGYTNILKDFWIEFSIRAFWLKARFCTLLGEIDEAFDYFDKVMDFLHCAEEKMSLSSFNLPNCHMDYVISVEKIKKQQDLLKRCQSLEKTQKLYECEEYAEVVDLLKLTFSDPHGKSKRNILVTTSAELVEAGIALPDRRAQLQLMLDSLSKLDDPKKYVVWGEVVFNECLQMYKESTSHSVKDEWINIIIQLFTGMDAALLKEPTSIKELSSACTLQIAKNLIRVICDSVDVPEYATDMPIPTVLPWKLLYHIIRNEESKLQASQADGKSESELLDNSMSSSLMLLNVAHDYLGRHSWCTRSDGELLVFFMSVIKEERAHYPEDTKHAFKDELDQAFEQCIYCLYGHPTKKGKSRYLQDHNALQIDLNWEMSQVLFDYFKPKTVPEFDSYKTNTVSGELENLARRITLLVPKEKNPVNTYESVLAYIEGQHNDPPSVPDKPVTTAIVKELYYILADYYFKNKEQGKAIKFYMLDICVNPNRLDSWAGMSLARMSRLEQKLNSTELRMDQAIYKQAIASLRCFTRAVEIDCNNAKLWIEYGSLAYQLHSHAARQLKLMHWFPLNDEMYQIATVSNKEMLLIAANCYKKASECEVDGGYSEEWLYSYMMGKVCEKMRKPARKYLEHYKQAAYHLHEDFAAYPKKINYVVSPPHLAVESLELFYRQHVAILKELLYKNSEELDLDYFEEYMIEVANGPFANQREKRYQRNKDSNNEDNHNSSSGRVFTVEGTYLASVCSNARSGQDHNYFHTKGNDSSSVSTLSDEVGGNPSNKVKMVETMLSKTSPKVNPTKFDSKTSSSSASSRENSHTNFINMPPRLSKVDLSQPIFGLDDQFTTSVGEDYLDSAIDTETMNCLGLDSLNALLESEDFDKPSDDLIVIDVDAISGSEEEKGKTPDGSHKHSDKPTDSGPNNNNTTNNNNNNNKNNNNNNNTNKNNNGSETVTPKPSDPVVKQEVSKPLDSVKDQKNLGTKTKTATECSSVSKSEPLSVNKSEPFSVSKSEPFSVSKSENISVNKSENISVNKSENISVNKSENISVNKSENISVNKSENISVNKSENISVNKSENISVNKSENISVNKSEPPFVSKPEPPFVSKPELPFVSKPEHFDDKRSKVEKHKKLLNMVTSALHICLTRFPTHYKALYRLAHLHFYSPFNKNIMYTRDILLGVVSWTQLDHLPAPGLFTDRKHSNFFQGVWRIPVEEVDRSGSFASHMNRSVKLLLEVLRLQCDNMMLFQIHVQLNRTPDVGRKYLRDAERVCLSKLAFEYALDTIELQLEEVLESDSERQIKFLMEVYKLWCHGVNKAFLFVERTNDIFLDVFRVIMKNAMAIKSTTVEQLEQALRFCQQQLSYNKISPVTLHQPPTQGLSDYQRQHNQQQQQQHHHHQHTHHQHHQQVSGGTTPTINNHHQQHQQQQHQHHHHQHGSGGHMVTGSSSSSSSSSLPGHCTTAGGAARSGAGMTGTATKSAEMVHNNNNNNNNTSCGGGGVGNCTNKACSDVVMSSSASEYGSTHTQHRNNRHLEPGEIAGGHTGHHHQHQHHHHQQHHHQHHHHHQQQQQQQQQQHHPHHHHHHHHHHQQHHNHPSNNTTTGSTTTTTTTTNNNNNNNSSSSSSTTNAMMMMKDNNNDDKLSIFPPEKLTSDVQAKMSCVEPIDLTGGSRDLIAISNSGPLSRTMSTPAMLGLAGPPVGGDPTGADMSGLDPRKLIKPCTVKLAAIPRSLMHSNTLTIKPSPSTEDIKQRLKTVLMNQSRPSHDGRLHQSTSEPSSPSTHAPDTLMAHSH